MTYKPPVVALDFETSGLDYWSPDFQVLSAAIAYRGDSGEARTRFIEADAIPGVLAKIAADGIPVVVHNMAYEYGVIKNKYSQFENIQLIDTMRLAQVYDNGGSKDSALAGFGLAKCVQRILGRDDPKAEYYEILRLKGVKRGQEGANLSLLGDDYFRAYNVRDALETLYLYEYITTYFTEIGYDWQLDHMLYVGVTKRISDAQARGVKVDRDHLLQTVDSLRAEIEGIDVSFDTRFEAEIDALEQRWEEAWVNALATEKGREKRRLAALNGESPTTFNTGSKKHLEELFIGELGLTPQFHTPTGKPSFKASHLHTYGSGGALLSERGKKGVVLAQATTLLELSEGDGRWHLGLKPTGTATGRFAGTGGLNAQGLARRDIGLMGSLVADPGHTFVSVDLSSGEPTATCHYSGDKNYEDAIFNMVGKRPYFDDRGVLKIDDIYLTAASFSPLGKDAIAEAFNTTYEGVPAATMWLQDPDRIKAGLKQVRDLHKILVLGIGYSMGPRKMVKSCYEKGHIISHKQAKEFFKAYWAWCPSVRALADRLEKKFLADGYLVNDFGYRLLPDAPHKAFNYWIQSTISGVMNALIAKFFWLCPQAQFVTVIHDELIFQVPDELLERAEIAVDNAVGSLNFDLGWTVKIRTGWAVGKDLYHAK